MYVRKRIGRRRSFHQKHGMPFFLLACAAICLLGLVLRQPAVDPVRALPPASLEKADAPGTHKPLQPAKYERTVYPYSVIPGGVRTRAELASNIADDPVVAGHYANFEMDRARFIKSDETQFVHVAYRLRNKIFWTAKTVKIPKGETLITDGKSVARTRCGNKVSVLPQEPVSGEEPPVETFDMPVFEIPMIASMEPPQLDLTKPPEAVLEISPTVPVVPYVPIQPSVFDNPRHSALRPLALFQQFNEVPEPGTIGLAMLGLVAFFVVRFTRKK